MRTVRICAFLAAVLAVSEVRAADWPGFRGPNHDGSVRDVPSFDPMKVALKVTWKHRIGSGYSALAVGDEGVIAMFDSGPDDVVAAFDPETGEERWRYRISKTYAGHDGSHDGPIATPVLAGGRVFGLGGWGHLFAVNAKTGKELWKCHIADDHGAKSPHYGFTTSPLVCDDVLVVEIGAGEGKAFAGFDTVTGDLLWAFGDDEVAYHSPVVATIGGRKQVLAVGTTFVHGVDAKSGETLWSYKHGGDKGAMGGQTIIPVPAGENRFFLTSKNDESIMIEVSEENGAEKIWSTRFIKQSYVTPAYHDGYLYGMSNRIFTCIDAADGEAKWRSREPGDCFPTVVGDYLVMMTKPGSLHLAEATPEAYKELASVDLFDEHSWSEVACWNGHLYARGMAYLARIDFGSADDVVVLAESVSENTEFGAFLAEIETASDKNAVIDAYFEKQPSFPIIEDDGRVHFVYRGEGDDVGIVGDMIGFRREDPMTRVEGTDLFYYSMLLEPDAAVAYGFISDFGTPAADPRNPRSGAGLFGPVSWFSMPAWKKPGYLEEAEDAKRGALESVEWDSNHPEGAKRTAQVYLPVGYSDNTDRRYPVIYVNGGKEAMERGSMKNALDHLIGSSIDPVIAVFVMPVEGEPQRGGDPGKYTDVLVSELLPLIDGKFRTIPKAAARAVVGTGDGGGSALHAGLSHPDQFGRIGTQSPMLMTGTEYDDALKSASGKPLVIYHSWGSYHLRSPHEAWDMAEGNRKFWSALRDAGFRPAGGEVPEGYGWACWRGGIGDMMRTLFPIQLP